MYSARHKYLCFLVVLLTFEFLQSTEAQSIEDNGWLMQHDYDFLLQVTSAESNSTLKEYFSLKDTGLTGSDRYYCKNWNPLLNCYYFLFDLDLDTDQTGDTIPTEIFSLEGLRRLKLTGSASSIPTEIGLAENLEELYIELPSSDSIPFSELNNLNSLSHLTIIDSFSGQIPDLSIPVLKNLTIIGDRVSGTVPTDFSGCPEIGYITIISSGLTGTIPALTDVITPNLKTLHVEGGIGGPVPASLGTLWNSTQHLIFKFGGSSNIPAALGELDNLKTLSMSGGRLSGTIPSELENLQHLQHFIIDGGVDGPFPDTLDSWVNLKTFDMRNFKNTLNLPSYINNWISLETFYFDSTSSDGVIPANIGLLTNLVSFHYRAQNKNKNIPPELGSLGNLKNFFLEGLNGKITLDQNGDPEVLGTPFPAELGNLGLLETMEFNAVIFRGGLPTEIGQLTNLRSLKITGCTISTTLPTEFLELTNLQYLDLTGSSFYPEDLDPFRGIGMTIMPENLQ